MQVIILAGGYGSRISEETITKPKPMVQIGNLPILIHIMNYYSFFGYKDFIICLGYMSEKIKEYFVNFVNNQNDIEIDLKSNEIQILKKNKKLDWNIKLIDTGLETQTAGRLLKIKKYINKQNFLFTYGDGLSNININKLIKLHLSKKTIATLSTIQTSARFGELDLTLENKVKKFSEKPRSKYWINAGYAVFNKKIFNYIKDEKTILEKNVLKKLARDEKLYSYKHKGFFYAMDSLRDKFYLNNLYNKGKAPWILK